VDTEEEQLEALRSWWKENGRSIVVGLVIGLGGVFGWTSRKAHTERRAEQASIEYQKLADTALRDDHAAAIAQAEALVAEFPSSGYAPLAALLAARGAFLADRVDDARRHLRWVIDNASTPGVTDVARIRLARLLIDAGEHAEAGQMLDAVQTGAVDALVQEVRGDLMRVQGDSDGARGAYTAALSDEGLTPSGRTRVRMKLDDLGPDASKG
jgi:predicted negative regulator of RcsB-dependent stress response